MTPGSGLTSPLPFTFLSLLPAVDFFGLFNEDFVFLRDDFVSFALSGLEGEVASSTSGSTASPSSLITGVFICGLLDFVLFFEVSFFSLSCLGGGAETFFSSFGSGDADSTFFSSFGSGDADSTFFSLFGSGDADSTFFSSFGSGDADSTFFSSFGSGDADSTFFSRFGSGDADGDYSLCFEGDESTKVFLGDFRAGFLVFLGFSSSSS